jgi:DNA mismatch endonuclease (patch repair protein)
METPQTRLEDIAAAVDFGAIGRMDNLTPQQRRKTMQAVKGRDTRPELALRRTLWAFGLRGWRCHRRSLPGQPDLAFGRAKVAVFVDGAFWHGRSDKYWPGRSGSYWDAKIARNMARDKRVDSELRALGWEPLRFWDTDVLADPKQAAHLVIEALARSREASFTPQDGPIGGLF